MSPLDYLVLVSFILIALYAYVFYDKHRIAKGIHAILTRYLPFRGRASVLFYVVVFLIVLICIVVTDLTQ